MQYRFRTLLFFFSISFCSVYFFSCASRNNNADEIANPDSNTPLQPDPNVIPQFVNTDYIELNKIYQVSKFRSGIGHDYSDDFEHCRSMKHYYQPFDSVNWTSIKIFSPITGTVDRIFEEWAGTQIQIKSDQYPNFIFIIFHVKLLTPLNVGNKVSAGNQIGTHIGSQTMSDIAVVQVADAGRKMISYFNVMTDVLFQNYQQRGITSRNDFIISKEARDADPINCNGETFGSSGTISNWSVLK